MAHDPSLGTRFRVAFDALLGDDMAPRLELDEGIDQRRIEMLATRGQLLRAPRDSPSRLSSLLGMAREIIIRALDLPFGTLADFMRIPLRVSSRALRPLGARYQGRFRIQGW